MKKRFTSMLLAVIMVLSLASTTVFAASTDDPQNDTERFYTLKNVKETGRNKERLKYYTDWWQMTSEYTVTSGSARTFSVSLAVEAQKGSFPMAAVSNAAARLGFDVSFTKTFSVGSKIPADADKYSKLAVYQETVTRKGDLYYCTIYGPYNETSRYVGSGQFTVPTDLYLEVEYQ